MVRKMFAIGDFESSTKSLLRKVGPRQLDGRRRQIHAGNLRAAFRKPRQIHAGATADLENHSSAVAVKPDEPEQVMKLFEMVRVEIIEKTSTPDRVTRDLEIVDVAVPVRAHLVDGGHRRDYSSSLRLSALSCLHEPADPLKAEN